MRERESDAGDTANRNNIHQPQNAMAPGKRHRSTSLSPGIPRMAGADDPRAQRPRTNRETHKEAVPQQGANHQEGPVGQATSSRQHIDEGVHAGGEEQDQPEPRRGASQSSRAQHSSSTYTPLSTADTCHRAKFADLEAHCTAAQARRIAELRSHTRGMKSARNRKDAKKQLWKLIEALMAAAIASNNVTVTIEPCRGIIYKPHEWAPDERTGGRGLAPAGGAAAPPHPNPDPDPTHTYKHTSNNKRQKTLLEYKKDGALVFSDGVT